MAPPNTVAISLSQHMGKAAVPVVKAGDIVDKGQKIGDVDNSLGCPVHSSVSGTVKSIEEIVTPNGAKVAHLIIENDHCGRLSPDIKPGVKRLNDITPNEIIEIVKNAGISGMGGAGFPTYAKISSSLGKINHMIINCAECEPYITANHRLLLERPEEIINGGKILLKTFGLRKGIIAIEDNKLDAVEKLSQAIGDSPLFEIRIFKTKYPQGDERLIISALTGKEFPAGKIPADVGCVVFNAETVSAVFRAVSFGMPLIERIVTVAGDCVRRPQNLLAPIGTYFSDLIDFCGGLIREPYKIIDGGPMMGISHWDSGASVKKTTNAVLVFSDENQDKYSQSPVCIRCGRCVQVCPMKLMPNYLAIFSKAGELGEAMQYGIKSCTECGTCEYVCPGKLPLVKLIRMGKSKIAGNVKPDKKG